MKRQFKTGTIALLAFCAGCAVSFFTLPIWIIPWIKFVEKGEKSDWLGFVGSVGGSALSSAIAAVAIYFAAVGIRRQIRVTDLYRQEDRIVREIPGLRGAAQLLDRFVTAFMEPDNFYGIGRDIEDFGLGSEEEFDAKLKHMLPTTDDGTLLLVRGYLKEACDAARAAENSQTSAFILRRDTGPLEQWDPQALRERQTEIQRLERLYTEQRHVFREAHANILRANIDITRRIVVFRGQLIELRREANDHSMLG